MIANKSKIRAVVGYLLVSERDTIRDVQIRADAVRIYYKYSTLPRGISINIAPKVGIFPEAEGRGKYSLPRVQYYRYFTRKG